MAKFVQFLTRCVFRSRRTTVTLDLFNFSVFLFFAVVPAACGSVARRYYSSLFLGWITVRGRGEGEVRGTKKTRAWYLRQQLSEGRHEKK